MSPFETDALAAPLRAGMSPDVFSRLRAVIYEHTGIYFHESKQYLVESRVSERMRRIGIRDFDAYCDVLCRQHTEREMPLLLNSVTVNETSFFRHQAQFDVISEEILPEIVEVRRCGRQRCIRLWSAGCATGEEAYSLALLCLETLAPRYPEFQFSVLGTDINTDVLDTARSGAYGDYAVRHVPEDMLRRYFDVDGPCFRIRPEVREIVEFKQHNLMDDVAPLSPHSADFILCANVLIYFDVASRRLAVEHLNCNLTADGRLMLGFSESLHGVTESMTPVRLRRLTAYQNPDSPNSARRPIS